MSSRLTLVLGIVLLLAKVASAHEGPTYAVLVDQKVDRYTVSIWSDPDVGEALFFVILSAPEPPADLRVQIGVQPVSGRLPAAFYAAERESVQGRVQYRAQAQFDAQELWRWRVRLDCAQGNGETGGRRGA